MDDKQSSSNLRVISVFVLVMINVAAIASLRGLPAMAELGLSSVFYFVVIALLFFIPTALVSAELATGWPKKGGVYVWIKEAFGQRWGFLAIWLQWIQNVIWYPTVLSFTAATLAYVFSPALASNPLYMLGVILAVYWGATLANFRGMKTSGTITTIGAVGGTILPALIIIILAGIWISSGNALQIEFNFQDLVPDLSSIGTIVLAASVLLGFCGMEMSAVHAQEVRNPQNNFPRAILLSTALILGIFILGTLSIAIVVPTAKISLVAGIMQAFTSFFDAYNIGWMVPIIALLIVLGSIGSVSTWIVGPSKGLFATASEGSLPPFFQKVNKNGMPVNLMLVQAGIVTLLALIFLLMPNVSSSYWILTALTAQLYLIMYVLLFLAALKLRYSRPEVPRAYRIPFGKLGMWVVAGVGSLAALSGIFIGFFPPSQLQTGNIIFYESFLVVGILLVVSAPLVIHHFRKPEWVPKTARQDMTISAAPEIPARKMAKADRIAGYTKKPGARNPKKKSIKSRKKTKRRG
ncbi:MAG: amino acid permease [Candidatus Micrarchaeota archaeon]